MHCYTPNSKSGCVTERRSIFLTHLPLVSVRETCSGPAGSRTRTRTRSRQSEARVAEAVQTDIQEAHLLTFSCQYAYFPGSIHFLFLGHFTHFIKPHFKCQWFHWFPIGWLMSLGQSRAREILTFTPNTLHCTQICCTVHSPSERV